MGEVIQLSSYKSKKNDIHEQDIMKDILIQDYIDFYIELKEKDPLLYNFLEATKSSKI